MTEEMELNEVEEEAYSPLLGLDLVTKIETAARKSARGLTRESARALCDMYDRHQHQRIVLGNQRRALIQGADEEPEESLEVIEYFASQHAKLEKAVASLVGGWAESRPEGAWARSILGIGPVISAGLCAHVDITKARTAGAIWAFAGLNPDAVWKKGEKRPWSADMKQIAFKIGDSFVKLSGREDSFYSQLYKQRKLREIERNEDGLFEQTAKETLEAKNIKAEETRAWYERGMLPPGRIELRARRYAVKIFLSHFHEVAYVSHYGQPTPVPFALAHQEHAHELLMPNMPDFVYDMRKANGRILPG